MQAVAPAFLKEMVARVKWSALLETATPEQFLSWLVAHDARVQHFERLTMSLEEIFVRVAHGAETAA